MEQVSASFRKRKEGRPLVLGLFFDPLAHAPYGLADMTGLSKPLVELAGVQERSARNQSEASLHDLSKEKLRNQVLHFVAYLRQEMILPKE
jgi:hypothetical protein